MTWDFKKYFRATASGVEQIEGYVSKGLGLNMQQSPSPKGHRPAIWCLTHLGSGHRIAVIKAPYEKAINIAADFRDATDWDFDGLHGWQNRDPELKEKVKLLWAKYDKYMFDGWDGHRADDEQAREIVRRNLG